MIVELGAGYGGLGHQIVSCFGRPCTYVIFDLPEVLYWSAAFLIVNNPDKRFYIHDPCDSGHTSMADLCAEYDYVFFPNFEYERIRELAEIALFVNLQSFQEMNDRQIELYASTAAGRLRGGLYSENFSRHPFNPNLTQTVDEHLSRWFDLTPDPSFLYAWHDANASAHPDPNLPWQLFPYVGTPKRGDVTLVPVDNVIAIGWQTVRLD